MEQMHRLRFVWIILLVIMIPAAAHAAPPARPASQSDTCTGSGALTLDGYEQCVREAYAAARSSDRISLDQIAPRLAQTREIGLGDGTSVPADNAWLTQALAQEPPDYGQIEARLAAIIDALSQQRSAQDPDALRKLDEVFSRPPFESRDVPSAWMQFWRGVGNAIEAFFDWIFGSMPTINPPATPPTPRSFGNMTPLGWTLLIIGLLLVLALVIYAFRGVRQSLVRDAKVRADAADDEEKISAGEALGRAQAQATAGDYRTAARYLYLSSLLWLDERRLLRYDRSLTNREYLDETRANQALHDKLAPVVNTFDRVWYGHRELEEADFRAYEEQVRSLRDLESKP